MLIENEIEIIPICNQWGAPFKHNACIQGITRVNLALRFNVVPSLDKRSLIQLFSVTEFDDENSVHNCWNCVILYRIFMTCLLQLNSLNIQRFNVTVFYCHVELYMLWCVMFVIKISHKINYILQQEYNEFETLKYRDGFNIWLIDFIY